MNSDDAVNVNRVLRLLLLLFLSRFFIEETMDVHNFEL